MSCRLARPGAGVGLYATTQKVRAKQISAEKGESPCANTRFQPTISFSFPQVPCYSLGISSSFPRMEKIRKHRARASSDGQQPYPQKWNGPRVRAQSMCSPCRIIAAHIGQEDPSNLGKVSTTEGFQQGIPAAADIDNCGGKDHADSADIRGEH